MLPFAESAALVLLAFGASGATRPAAFVEVTAAADSAAAHVIAPGVGPSMAGERHPVALAFALAVAPAATQPDTARRRRRTVEYSDGYGRRVTLHRRLSYAMLPLFAASYFSGDQILGKGTSAPSWAKNTHGPAATATAVLFGANLVTGSWNLWEGRHDPNGRTRRITHAVLFLGASAGFTYAGSTLAEAAETSSAKQRQHRNVNLASMSVATTSWLLMLLNR